MLNPLLPAHLTELRETLARAHAKAERIGPINLKALNRVIEHVPEDMTVTVEAGLTLGALQNHLRPHGQWLPVDPPQSEHASLESIIAANACGPRRYGCGTPRDYVIGLRVALADGTVIKSGGKVVKNVAGYDMAKLFIGSRGSLGVIVEVSLKLRPLPEKEEFVQATFADATLAFQFVETVLESKMNPVVLDLHRGVLTGGKTSAPSTECTVVLGFAGTCEDVDLDRSRALDLGAATPSHLEHELVFWSDAGGQEPVHRRSVLPSKLGDTLHEIGPVPFVARAGNGVLFHRGGPVPVRRPIRSILAERVKNTFDPKHVFPEVPA